MKSDLPSQITQEPLPDVPVAQTAPGRGGAWRKACDTVLLGLIGVIIFGTWCIEGLFQPLVVPSGSMAETLLGTHRTVECADCGFRFHCGSDVEPLAGRAVCPNCGCTENDLTGLLDLPGDRILLNKTAFFFRRPRAWEVVAFREPGRAERIVVKRVVGLPGETIALKDGDVYADGKIRRKPLRLQQAMAVLVHDAAFAGGRRGSQYVELHAQGEPQREPAVKSLKTRLVTNRWITDSPQSAWNYRDGRFTHPAGPQTGKPDWLTFCPGRLGPEKANPQQPGKWISSPVTDLCGYNQTRPRRIEDVHAVDDLMLSLQIAKILGHGKMSIRAGDAQSEFLISIAFEAPAEEAGGSHRCQARIEARRNGRSPKDLGRKTMPLPEDFADRGVSLQVSLFDCCLLVAVEGQEVLNYPYDPRPRAATSADESTNTARAARRPLAIGSDGLGLVLHSVRVYRDVYYAYPSEVAKDTQCWGGVQLGPDEYYVLGDNSAISVDSRTWSGNAAVSHNLLQGKPLAVFLSGKNVNVAGRHFQVPDIGRIRYIR